MNKVILLGRLVKDPEIKVTSNGKTFARFTVAVNRRYVSGEKRDADFIPCKAWNKTAEFVGNWFNKGARILLEGEMRSERYEKNGKKIYRTEVLVSNANFVDYKKKDGDGQEPMKSFGAEVGYDDEIPF